MASLWIVNKAGGLVFQSEHFAYPNQSEQGSGISSNDYLIMAGTLHGIHAITSRILPAPGLRSQGLEVLEADGVVIRIRMTETGTKLVLVCQPAHPNAEGVLQRAYELYVDHVMKNPFYIAEMPIRIQAFDREVAALLQA